MNCQTFIEGLIPVTELESMGDRFDLFNYKEARDYLHSKGKNLTDFYFTRDNPPAWFCYYKDFVLVDIPVLNQTGLAAMKIVEEIDFQSYRLQSCLNNQDYKYFFYLIDPRIALNAFDRLFELIPDQEKYSLFWSLYSRCRFRLEAFPRTFIEKIINYRAGSIYIPGADKQEYIEVYLGQKPGARSLETASSWTLDVNTAIDLASKSQTQGSVYQAKVKKDNVLAYVKYRNEKEIVVYPDNLLQVKQLNFTSLKDIRPVLEEQGVFRIFGQYTQLIKPQYFYRPSGIHGIQHTKRVLLLVLILIYYLKINRRGTRILCSAAVYHDIGRTNDNFDPAHGRQSFNKLCQNKLVLPDDAEEREIIKYIIENHCISDKKAYQQVANYQISDQKEAIFLYNVFKDADGLDRIRINDLDVKHLRNAQSKSLLLIARELLHQHL